MPWLLIHALGLLAVVSLGAAAEEPPALPRPDLSALEAPYDAKAASALAEANAHPDDAERVGALGNLLHSLGRMEDAAACYARAHALEPAAFRWAYYSSVSLERLGRRKEALQTLEQARESSGEYAPFYVRLGELLRGEGRLEEAAKALARAIELQPELASAHLALGRTHAAAEHWEDAIASYERAVELARNYAAAHYALGLAYRRVGKQEEAKRSLERYQKLRPIQAPNFDPLLDAIAALRSGGAAPDATADFTPGQRRAFVDELERTLQANPGLASAHANLIALYWQLGDAAKAESHYRQAVGSDPGYADAYYNWGSVQLALGDQAAALASFERALASDPNHGNALVQSGLLIERAGRGEEAEQRYRAALDSNPMQRQANYLLARRLVGKGELEAAAERLEQTVRIEDEATPGYLRALAATYSHMGKVDTARERLEEAARQARALGRGDLAAGAEADLARLPQ